MGLVYKPPTQNLHWSGLPAIRPIAAVDKSQVCRITVNGSGFLLYNLEGDSRVVHDRPEPNETPSPQAYLVEENGL
jgi:hypothetical protein